MKGKRMSQQELLEKIRSHRAKIGVIGLGYVGLPLVLRFGEEHFSILGFDVDTEKVRKLNAGESYIRHIDASRLQNLRKDKQFEATTDFSRLAEADAIIICVPTPLTAKKDPDLQYIDKTAESVHKTLRKGQGFVNRLGGFVDVLKIGIFFCGQRGGNADDDRIRFGKTAEIGRRFKLLVLSQVLQTAGVDMADVGFSGIQFAHFFGVDVETQYGKVFLPKPQDQWQPDV